MTRSGFFGLPLVLLGLLVRPSLAQVPKPEQCVASGIYSLIRLPEPKDASGCWTDCLAEAECHMAVVVTRLGGSDLCLLVNCQKQGEHSFTRQPSEQIAVYSRNTADGNQRGDPSYCQTKIDLQPHQSHKIMIFSNYSGFPRFFYNSNTYKCEFFYSGCPSCRNNFETKEACEALCNEKFRCYRPMQFGECSAEMPKFFYNISNERCESFIFSGCGSNGNIFSTVEECESLCGDVRDTAVPVPTGGTGTSPPATSDATGTTTSQPAVDSDFKPATATSPPDEDSVTTVPTQRVLLLVVIPLILLAVCQCCSQLIQQRVKLSSNTFGAPHDIQDTELLLQHPDEVSSDFRGRMSL